MSAYARKRAMKKLMAFGALAVLAGGVSMWFFSDSGPGTSEAPPQVGRTGSDANMEIANGGDYYADALADLRRAVVSVEDALIELSESDVRIREDQAEIRQELLAVNALVARLAANGAPADDGPSVSAMPAAGGINGGNGYGGGPVGGGANIAASAAAAPPAAVAPMSQVAAALPAPVGSGGDYEGFLIGRIADLDACEQEAVARRFPEYLVKEMAEWDADAATEADLVAWRRVFERAGMADICADRLTLNRERSKGRRNESYRDACYSYFVRKAVVEYAGNGDWSIVSSPRASFRSQEFYDGIGVSVEHPDGGATFDVVIGGGSVNPWLWGISRLEDDVDSLVGDDYWKLRWLGRHIERVYGENACLRWRPDIFADDMRYAPWDEIAPDLRDVAMIADLRTDWADFDLERPSEAMIHLSRAAFIR